MVTDRITERMERIIKERFGEPVIDRMGEGDAALLDRPDTPAVRKAIQNYEIVLFNYKRNESTLSRRTPKQRQAAESSVQRAMDKIRQQPGWEQFSGTVDYPAWVSAAGLRT